METLKSYLLGTAIAVGLLSVMVGPTLYTVYVFNPRFEATCRISGGVPVTVPGERSLCAGQTSK